MPLLTYGFTIPLTAQSYNQFLPPHFKSFCHYSRVDNRPPVAGLGDAGIIALIIFQSQPSILRLLDESSIIAGFSKDALKEYFLKPLVFNCFEDAKINKSFDLSTI
jgi:hypothetical protein